MQKLINLGLWMSGMGPKLWEKVDGSKTYIAVALKMLTALAGIISTLQPLLDAHNLGGIAAFCKGLSTDPNWKMLTDALLALGIGHKIDKAADASAPTEAPKA